MNGQELCDVLKIDYNAILEIRKQDMEDNLDYFLDELLKIEDIRIKITDKLNHNQY